MKQIIFSILIISLFIVGCQEKREYKIGEKPAITSENLVADTIIYSVLIQNFDEFDLWADERLKNTNHKKIIETIFDQAYKGTIDVYDYFSNKKLSIDDIKKIESSKEYSRDIINELQFTEVWYMDTKAQWFYKEIISITLGYPVYDTYSGEQRGLKAVFKFKLKKN